MKTILFLSVATLCLFELPSTNGECFEKMKSWKAVPIDPAFYKSVDQFYYPLTTKIDLRRKSAAILKQKWDDVDESKYDEACIRVKFDGNDVKLTGYGGKTGEYKVYQTSAETWTWTRPLEGGGMIGGHSKETMTDGKTYVVAPDCTLDDKFSWSAITTVPELPKETEDAIIEHIVSLGGKRENVRHVKYDKCK